MAGEFTTDMGVLAGIQGLNNRFEWYYGDVEPVNPRPFLNWGHLSEDLWKQRNAENTDWIIRGNLSQSYFGLVQQSMVESMIESMIDIIDPLGHPKEYYGTILPPRHLWVDGKTIGDASSGATARANADVFDLYAVLWGAVDNTNSQIKIYNDAGVLIEKGASATADFAAHKRISLPDKRGRASIGIDNMGGTSANVVTNPQADIVGGWAGAETHELTAAQNGPHTHNVRVYSSASGSGHVVTRSGDGGTSYTVTEAGLLSGSGSPHNNMQPWIACNWIMRY